MKEMGLSPFLIWAVGNADYAKLSSLLICVFSVIYIVFRMVDDYFLKDFEKKRDIVAIVIAAVGFVLFFLIPSTATAAAMLLSDGLIDELIKEFLSR